jgi:hypothetical protein
MFETASSQNLAEKTKQLKEYRAFLQDLIFSSAAPKKETFSPPDDSETLLS